MPEMSYDLQRIVDDIRTKEGFLEEAEAANDEQRIEELKNELEGLYAEFYHEADGIDPWELGLKGPPL